MLGCGGTIARVILEGNDVLVKIGDDLVSTGRRQFGTIIGANGSVGIACIILLGE